MFHYTINFHIDSVAHIAPGWCGRVEASNAVDIALSWERMVGKECGASTESNSCSIPDPVEFPTFVCEHSIWPHSVGDYHCLEIVFLCQESVKFLCAHVNNSMLSTCLHLNKDCLDKDTHQPSELPASLLPEIVYPQNYWYIYWHSPAGETGLNVLMW